MSPARLTLHAFLASADGQLSLDERERIVEQASLLIEHIYAHLPQKRAMFAVDPVRRLRLLRRGLSTRSELAFHREMTSIFDDLRDLHTTYTLPEPFRSHVALLPFVVEPFFEAGQRVYLVSKVAPWVEDPSFCPGVELRDWRGVPMERAVDLCAERQPGATEASRRARGIAALTLRPLASSPWPDEAWVDLRYVGADHVIREIRFDWEVAKARDRLFDDEGDNPEATATGVDRASAVVRRTKIDVYAPDVAALHEQTALVWASGGSFKADSAKAGDDPSAQSRLPDNFSFRIASTPSGEVGYLRIWSFENTATSAARAPIRDFVEAFVVEFIRILEKMPPRGLILDIRGNPGGLLPAGERLLELLTPRPIVGAPLCVRATPLIADLCRLAPEAIELSRWLASVTHASETGATYSAALPFFPFAHHYNSIGQRYDGPVVLVVDGLCYSTADIFAGGFQDHAIGPILGIDDNMGAGGGNNWSHQLLTRLLQDSKVAKLEPLKSGASFMVAVRQVVRVGARAGMPLEDIGITPDHVHSPTRRDLLDGNPDMIARAAEIVTRAPARALSARVTRAGEAELRLTKTTLGIDRLDVYIADRPRATFDVVDGAAAHTLADDAQEGARVELRGFAQGALVARRLLRVVV